MGRRGHALSLTRFPKKKPTLVLPDQHIDDIPVTMTKTKIYTPFSAAEEHTQKPKKNSSGRKKGK
jgi:hypothetical protein